MLTVRECTDAAHWDAIIDTLHGHPLQLWGWGELKGLHRWSAKRLEVLDGETAVGAAQILTRRLPLGQSLHYVPRGPAWAAGRGDDVVGAVAEFARRHGKGLSLTVEPDSGEMPQQHLFRRADSTILLPTTMIVRLEPTEDELLANMQKSTRYYCRKTTKDLEVRRVTDIGEVERIMDVYDATAERAGFELHSRQYYRDIFTLMGDRNLLLAVYVDDAPVAFVWTVTSAHTAFELYGGMNAIGAKKRANYALKWAAIRHCKEAGLSRYDMNGLVSDGVSEFKRGFWSHHEDELVGTWEMPLSPLNGVFTQALPYAKRALRGMAAVRREGMGPGAVLRKLRKSED